MVPELKNTKLLSLFNSRDNVALSQVYSMFFDELHYYAIGLYRNSNIDASDAIHDVFLNLWLSNTKFEELINIKAYLFISVRNNFRQYLQKNKYFDKFKEYQISETDIFQIDIIESEVMSNMNNILNLLPDESAEILKMFFDGYNIDEISEKLGKSKRTIYNKKYEAISYLKHKISPDKLLILLLCCG